MKKTVNGLKKLTERNVSVRVGCVVAAVNEDCLEDMTEFCRTLKVKEVIYSRMEPAGRLEERSPLLSKKGDNELTAEINRIAERYMGELEVTANFKAENDQVQCAHICPGGSSFLYIDNDGHISPCTWAVEKKLTLRSKSSLKQKNLPDILKEESFPAFHALLKDSALKGKRGCPARWK